MMSKIQRTLTSTVCWRIHSKRARASKESSRNLSRIGYPESATSCFRDQNKILFSVLSFLYLLTFNASTRFCLCDRSVADKTFRRLWDRLAELPTKGLIPGWLPCHASYPLWGSILGWGWETGWGSGWESCLKSGGESGTLWQSLSWRQQAYMLAVFMIAEW